MLVLFVGNEVQRVPESCLDVTQHRREFWGFSVSPRVIPIAVRTYNVPLCRPISLVLKSQAPLLRSKGFGWLLLVCQLETWMSVSALAALWNMGITYSRYKIALQKWNVIRVLIKILRKYTSVSSDDKQLMTKCNATLRLKNWRKPTFYVSSMSDLCSNTYMLQSANATLTQLHISSISNKINQLLQLVSSTI